MAKMLVIGPTEIAMFDALKAYAAANPIDMAVVMRLIKTHKGTRDHLARMKKFTIALQWGQTVTFTIEEGHPAGTCRHFSMASPEPGRAPTPVAVWMVAEHFGFKGGLEACTVYVEDIGGGHSAINLIQPLAN